MRGTISSFLPVFLHWEGLRESQTQGAVGLGLGAQDLEFLGLSRHDPQPDDV